MPVAYEELEAPTYQFNRNGKGTCRRSVKIAYSDLHAFIQEYVGIDFNASPPNASIGAAVMLGFAGLICESLTISEMLPQLLDSSTPPNPLNGWRVEISYSTPDSDSGSDGGGGAGDGIFFTRKASVGADIITVPNTGLQWSSDSADFEEEANAGVRLSLIDHQINYRNVSVVPWSAIRSAVGKVNSSTYEGADSGTLLFVGCEISLDDNRPGMALYSVDYRFSERGQPWNYYFRPGSGWEAAQIKGSGSPPYESSSFSGIFPTS